MLTALNAGIIRGSVSAIAVLAVAVAGAIFTGSQIGSINSGVESLATASGTWLGSLADALPFGYAFGAGMVAAVNPCGFALLPAYLTLYLGDGSDGHETRGLPARLGSATAVSGVMTLGFVLVFGIGGVILTGASQVLARFLPVLGLAIGVALVILGGRMLSGDLIYANLGERIAGRLGARAQERGPRGYFAYGVAYAAASLSCALPIFLGVVAGAMASGGMVQATIQFVLYAMGMGAVIGLLTVSTAFVKYGVLSRARAVVPYVETASAALIMAAGGYVVYYWLTLGGLLHAVGLAGR